MSTNPNPGMVANSIQGFNRNWTAVQSHSDRKGNVVSWSFICGCGAEHFYKTRRYGNDTAHALALGQVESHRCPRRGAAEGTKRIAQAA